MRFGVKTSEDTKFMGEPLTYRLRTDEKLLIFV